VLTSVALALPHPALPFIDRLEIVKTCGHRFCTSNSGRDTSLCTLCQRPA
jgi:hypothetical protein